MKEEGRKMKKGNKLIAKLLCFALVVLTVLGYGSLKAEAEELGGLRIDITNQDSANGTVFYQFFKDDESVDEPVEISSSTTIPFTAGITKMKIKVKPGTNCQVGNYSMYVDGAEVSDAKEAAIS